MDDKYSDASVSFTLAPSRRARAFIAAAGLGTVALLLALPLSAPLRLALAMWCFAMAAHALARQRGSVIRIVDATSITVGELEGEVVSGSFVAPWLTIVRWRPRGKRAVRTLAVLPDMLDRESFRRLRVILRWGLHSAP
jgi:hypothetical protein